MTRSLSSPVALEKCIGNMTYGVVIHRAGKSWNAYVPELDGVVAVADSRDRVIELISQAIPLHLRDLAKDGVSVAADHGASEAITLVIA